MCGNESEEMLRMQGGGSDPRQSPVDVAGLMQQLVQMQAHQVHQQRKPCAT